MRPQRRCRRSERGAVGGAEGLVFGTLILLAGALVITNMWSVVETRAAVDAAAREYLRSYTRHTDRDRALQAGDRAARATLAARGTPLRDLQVAPPDAHRFGPCGEATVELTVTVPAATVPFIGELTPTEVRVRHSELIGAHREVISDARFDPEATLCAGS